MFFAVADLLNLEVDVLLFDTTSTYCERDAEDVGEAGDPGFRRYGHSKDHRTDLRQIVIGLAVAKEGIRVRVLVLARQHQRPAGCRPRSRTACGTRGWVGSSPSWIAGFSSTSNLDYLRRAGGHFIAEEADAIRSPLVEQALSRQGRYSQVRDNLRVKEVRLDAAPDRRSVICHNPEEAMRQKALRDAALERIALELDPDHDDPRHRAQGPEEAHKTTRAKTTRWRWRPRT